MSIRDDERTVARADRNIINRLESALIQFREARRVHEEAETRGGLTEKDRRLLARYRGVGGRAAVNAAGIASTLYGHNIAQEGASGNSDGG